MAFTAFFMRRSIRPRQAGWIAMVLCTLALAACETVQTTRGGVVGVERKQTMLLSASQVNQGADQAYQEIIQQARQKGILNRNPGEVERVRGIVRRLIPATGAFRPDAPGWDWDVNVIRSPEVNAWAMPGGKIAVYSGLIEKLRLTDSELAAILGHEIAHALREHGRERASQEVAEKVGLGVLSAAVGLGELGQNVAGLVTDVTFNLPHSRQMEREADRIGVELAARAGFDPRAAVSVWRKMERLAGGGGPPEILSTHPSNESRLKDLQQYAARVMPIYEARRQ